MKGLESIDDPRRFTPFTIITIITMSHNSAAEHGPVRDLGDEFAAAAGEHVTALTVLELEQKLLQLKQQLEKSVNDRFGQIRETAAAHTDLTKSAEERELYRRLLFKAFERVNDNERRFATATLQLATALLAAKTSVAALLAAEQDLAVRSGSLDSRLAAVFQEAAAKKTCQATRKTTRKKTLRRNIYCALPDGTNELVLTANVPRKKRKSVNMKRKSDNAKRGCM